MEEMHHISEFVGPIANIQTKGVRLGLSDHQGVGFAFFIEYGIAERLAASFVDSVNWLGAELRKEGNWQKVSTISQPQRIQCQRDELTDQVIVTITMPLDVPRRLCLSPQAARDVARLLAEASEDRPPDIPN